ncbi:FG-GAP-like repeat-containing protein [Zemynaea arenosa]|nr:FG-GAP-like repeat-containing protein [Massilia arenosa]
MSQTSRDTAAYQTTVQQLYIAYFGRPADPGGLVNFTNALGSLGVAADIQSLNAIYDSNPAVRQLVDAFGTSQESLSLYGGQDTRAFVTSIYLHVLGRSPDTDGLNYWSEAIDVHGLSKGHAALSIMAGALVNSTAQGKLDAQTIANKITMASNYSAALVTSGLTGAYNGDDDAARARDALSAVTSTTDPVKSAITLLPAHAVAGQKTEGLVKAVSVAGPRAAYNLTRNADGSFNATALSDGKTTRVAAGTTAIRFTDAAVNLTITTTLSSVAAADVSAVTDLYLGIFNRVPEADALEYWVRQRKIGQSLEQIASAMYYAAIQPASGSGLSSVLQDADFVTRVYTQLRGAAPDAAALQKYIAQIGTAGRGATVLAMRNDIRASSTATALLANKAALAQAVAVEQGLSYLSAADGATATAAVTAKVTGSDTSAALAAITGRQAGFTLAATWQASVQPDYSASIARTEVPVPLVTPQPSIKSANKTFFFHHAPPRTIKLVDLNNDGLDDVIVAPTLFDQGPKLPLEIWRNKGDGVFVQSASTLIDGDVPLTGSVNAIFVADFNRDGKPDIFLVDQGLEDKDCGKGCDGATNIVLMSQPTGKWKDVSSTLPGNSNSFNHVSSMGDVNGDGLPDIVIARLGGTLVEGEGVVIYASKGDGTFSRETTSLLPDEVAYFPSSEFYTPAFDAAHPAPYSRQRAGATAVGDLTGDGKNEIVTCSYAGTDSRIDDRTVRILQRGASGKYAEAARISIPAALKATSTLGCSGLSIADYDRDGRADLLVIWEDQNGAGVKAVILKGQGGLQFTDVTTAALGGYAIDYQSNGYRFNPLVYEFRDLNADGLPDIMLRSTGVTAAMLASGMPTSFLNRGDGTFTRQTLRLNGAAVNESQVAAAMGCDWCSYMPLFGKLQPHAAGDQRLDLLLWTDTEKTVTTPYWQESAVVLRTLLAR